MGQPKLLLPWKGQLIIDAVLRAWTSSRVERTLVVVRGDDRKLIQACSNWPVEIVELQNPTDDMKSSVVHGIKRLEAAYSLQDEDQVFVAPADLPRITNDLIDDMVKVNNTEQIVVPHFSGRSGHPIRIPWKMREQIYALEQTQGINVLLDSNSIHVIEFPERLRPRDIDTPEDYEIEVEAERGKRLLRSIPTLFEFKC